MKRFLEKIYPYLFGLIITSILFYYKGNQSVISLVNTILTKDILSLIITIESIVFGFLMTVLSLIIQMNNKAIEFITKMERYKDLIRFSKTSIYSAGIVVILSLFLILLPQTSNSLSSYFYIFALSTSFFTLYRFVNIFFILANSKE